MPRPGKRGGVSRPFTSKPAEPPRQLEFVYDSDEGLLPEIERLTAPPGSSKEAMDQSDSEEKAARSNNAGYCVACKEGGDLLCCDMCPASFHLSCQDPPITADQVPPGKWLCNRCEKTPVHLRTEKKKGGEYGELERNRMTIRRVWKENETEKLDPLSLLAKTALALNPTAYELPESIAPRYELPNDALPNGRQRTDTLICVKCQRYSRENNPVIDCDFCPLGWHLDCLDPPLTMMPKDKWMCPEHIEHMVDRFCLKSTSLTHRMRMWEEHAQQPVDAEITEKAFFKAVRERVPQHLNPLKAKKSRNDPTGNPILQQLCRAAKATTAAECFAAFKGASGSAVPEEEKPKTYPNAIDVRDLPGPSTRNNLEPKREGKAADTNDIVSSLVASIYNSHEEKMAQLGGSDEKPQPPVNKKECQGLKEICKVKFATSSDPRDRVIFHLAAERLEQIKNEVSALGQRAGKPVKAVTLDDHLTELNQYRESRKVDNLSEARRELSEEADGPNKIAWWEGRWSKEYPKEDGAVAAPKSDPAEKPRPSRGRGRPRSSGTTTGGTGRKSESTAGLATTEWGTAEGTGDDGQTGPSPSSSSSGRGLRGYTGPMRGRGSRGGKIPGFHPQQLPLQSTTPSTTPQNSTFRPLLVPDYKLLAKTLTHLPKNLKDKELQLFKEYNQTHMALLAQPSFAEPELSKLIRGHLVAQMRVAHVLEPLSIATDYFLYHLSTQNRLPKTILAQPAPPENVHCTKFTQQELEELISPPIIGAASLIHDHLYIATHRQQVFLAYDSARIRAFQKAKLLAVRESHVNRPLPLPAPVLPQQQAPPPPPQNNHHHQMHQIMKRKIPVLSEAPEPKKSYVPNGNHQPILKEPTKPIAYLKAPPPIAIPPPKKVEKPIEIVQKPTINSKVELLVDPEIERLMSEMINRVCDEDEKRISKNRQLDSVLDDVVRKACAQQTGKKMELMVEDVIKKVIAEKLAEDRQREAMARQPAIFTASQCQANFEEQFLKLQERKERDRAREEKKEKLMRLRQLDEENNLKIARETLLRRPVLVDDEPYEFGRGLGCEYDTRYFNEDLPIMAELHPEFGSTKPFAIQRFVTTLGTDANCHIQLDELVEGFCFALSERHADIVFDEKNYRFQLRIGAESRVLVNGDCYGGPSSFPSECICGKRGGKELKPISQAVWLTDGMWLRFGCALFLFRTRYTPVPDDVDVL
ncbi:unnamed protein product, partial [Mesorhabditis spiculigera]